MKAVVLAAGRGRRLHPRTREIPKALLPVAGVPLIDFVISGLSRGGIRDVLVVTGYRGSILENFLSGRAYVDVSVECVRNTDYQRGNGVSLSCAWRLLRGEPFLLHMVDHLVDPQLIIRLCSPSGGTSASVDLSPRFEPQLNDATRVLLDYDGNILRFGKRLDQFSGVDAGVFRCDPYVLDRAHELSLKKYHLTVSQVMNNAIDAGHSVRGIDVTSLLWLDIDTRRDLLFAERLLGELQQTHFQDLGWNRLKAPQPPSV